jgi:hypothetical protein
LELGREHQFKLGAVSEYMIQDEVMVVKRFFVLNYIKFTYSMNKVFHRSSLLQNACRNLQVYPSNRNSCESRYSKDIARISSGNN